jgi:putative transposase
MQKIFYIKEAYTTRNMAEKYLGLFQKESMRLKTHDYGTSSCYFITIDTFNMNEYFGELMPAQTGHDPSIQLTEIGKIARVYWIDIPKHYSIAELDTFIIMPNHIHGILNLNISYKETWEANKFGPQRNNLASVIGSYKASVKRYANKEGLEFKWKAGYHERIIWTPEELNTVQGYILQNPSKWLEKKKNNP